MRLPLIPSPIRSLTLCVLIVVLAACGGSGGDDGDASEPESSNTTTSTTTATTEATTSTTATETTAAETTAVETTAAETTGDTAAATGDTLPASPVTATLDTFYDFPNGTLDGVTLPFSAGDVRAWWYIEGDFYTLLYQGLPADSSACPGNSLQLASGMFDFVSNAALGVIDCSPSPTGIENTADAGVVVCGTQVFYRTLIPADVTGALFASVEIYDAELNGIGATSMVATAPGQAPELDLSVYGC